MAAVGEVRVSHEISAKITVAEGKRGTARASGADQSACRGGPIFPTFTIRTHEAAPLRIREIANIGMGCPKGKPYGSRARVSYYRFKIIKASVRR